MSLSVEEGEHRQGEAERKSRQQETREVITTGCVGYAQVDNVQGRRTREETRRGQSGRRVSLVISCAPRGGIAWLCRDVFQIDFGKMSANRMETRRPETLSTAMTARPWTKILCCGQAGSA
jgi:hypothetical protein